MTNKYKKNLCLYSVLCMYLELYVKEPINIFIINNYPIALLIIIIIIL